MDKPFFCEGSGAMIELEAMVDKAGIDNVLYALAQICRFKAMHVESAWQDRALARTWEKNANTIDKVPAKILPTH